VEKSPFGVWRLSDLDIWYTIIVVVDVLKDGGHEGVGVLCSVDDYAYNRRICSGVLASP